MNREYIDKQLELYDEGLTSFDEEKELLHQLGNTKTGANVWFNYIRQNKKVAPKNLESDIWSSIQHGEQRKKRLLLRATFVAASLVFALSLFLTFEFSKPKEMSYDEKNAVLKEALTLISESQDNSIQQEILYEDKNLIIYTK